MDDAARAHGVSLWTDQLGPPGPPRPALAGHADVDVAIVGAGYTGLWTAYSLLRTDPTLRVLIVERERVGFGASGRNGGWCVGELAGGLEAAVAHAGRTQGVALTRAIMHTVDEIGAVVAAEQIDCGFRRGGVIRLARTLPQLERQRAELERYRAHGFGDDVVRLLDATEATDRLAASNVRGGLYFAPCARLQPASLAHGLAAAVERLGATIVEQTAAMAIVARGDRRARGDGAVADRPCVVTDRGDVHADVVVRATEAYTRDLHGERRSLVPLYSLMIATEPLGDDVWDEIGLRSAETFADDRRMVIYGQRTADGRIAFGGRGAPYRFGSGIDPATERSATVHDRIANALVELVPAVQGATITHRWGGVLGVPRDWRPGVGVDRARGIAWAGGYVGEGVAAANLAGRTLADLVTGAATPLVALPWVGHRSRRWEPEPIRWAAITAARRLAGWIDDREERTGSTPRAASVLDRIVG